jgi:hypothetical protein
MSEAPVDSAAALRAQRLNGGTDAPTTWPSLIDITAPGERVPPFPTDLLPAPFSTFVLDVADRLQVPADFVAIPLLVTAATMLGREVWLAPKLRDDWKERACLWGAAIALPSVGKTPATVEALRAPHKMQHEFWESYKIDHAAWKKDNDRDPDAEPKFEALIVNDTTVEKLASMMMDSPRGMMLYRDELSGWFGSLNKYRARGIGDDRQFFLQCWSGGSHRVDRIGRSSVYVDGLYLSLYGTIQPAVAREAFRGGDADGMTARFGLLASPDMTESVAVIDQRPDFEARATVEQRLRDMRDVVLDRPLRFDGEAYALLNRWLLRLINRPEKREDTGFGQHISKYQALFPRLALTLHFMRHGSGAPMEVEVKTAQAVQSLIDGYLEPHARKVYGSMAVHPARAGAARIAGWLRKERVGKFTAANVRRKGWGEFAKANDEKVILEAMTLLHAYGWVRLEDKPSGVKGGRSTQIAIVNPAAYEVSTVVSGVLAGFRE